MKHELLLKQKQKLILTPQLYQSINILQLNLIELRNLINQELIENPLLEINQQKSKEVDKIKKEEENNYCIGDKNKNQEKINLSDYLSYLKEKEYPPFSIRPKSRKENRFEDVLSYKESLQDYLLAQLGVTTTNSLDYKIGEYIIGNIDENGYLNVSLELISKVINVEKDKIFEILQLIQSFDPPGIGARSLEECLLIQEKFLGYNNTNINKIIKYFLPDLAKKAFKKIAKELNVSIIEIQDLADVIKKNFDPKPGRQIASLSETKYIIPDLIIRKKANGEYRILQNDTFLPQIKINYQYRKILDRNAESSFIEKNRFIREKKTSNQKTKDTVKYIEKKVNSASLLIKSIEQRKKTVYRIAEALISYQKDFLDKGILFLKPLTLKEVADRLEIHESTVSRAIHNKNIQTPRGLIRMKYLFSKGIDNTNENNISSDKIKKMIRSFIETENHLKPWSDQKIADLLYLKEKINIARRTVAKYREALKILPSNLRKRFSQ